MAIEQREGVLDRVTEKGILLSGARLSYSKWFEGERPSEDLLGCKIRVVVDAGDKVSFLKKVVGVDGKAEGWKPPESPERGSPGGAGRRLSPEELSLKVEDGRRIARCCAVERAIDMARQGVTVQEIAAQAKLLEEYFVSGVLPTEAALPKPESTPLPAVPSPASAKPEQSPAPAPAMGAAAKPTKPKRLAARLISGLFNEALRGGLVEDWQDFLAEIEKILKVQIKNPYQLDPSGFSRVEAVFRSKLGSSNAA